LATIKWEKLNTIILVIYSIQNQYILVIYTPSLCMTS